ncbi:hypothetical protein DXA96_19950 [Lachnospiraceae bacterium OF09-33XD]|nr:hypothetical protein DXA96_19950 [Lachnospiraceae bacterium OF09-33XD]
MRFGWTKNKNSATYRTVKPVHKTFCSDRFICEIYGVTDPKAWAKVQVRLMNDAEKDDDATFLIELCADTDLIL